MNKEKGFNLVEVLIVTGLIGLLASAAYVGFGSARKKARDVKRKAELAQVGRLMQTGTCYKPTAGGGSYDIIELLADIKVANPNAAKFLPKKPPIDPSVGTDTDSGYIYEVTNDGKRCALYANLEHEEEEITLPAATEPAPGTGSGVLKGGPIGPNGTDIYFQISN